MDEFRLARGLAAEADVAAARLIVARVRNGGDLLIAVHGRDLNFNVIRPRHGGRAIARGELDCAEVEAQPLDQALGLADQLLEVFGYLINKAKGIITDSGNVAEEATFLGIPCITLNTYAEHPETWRMGTNELVGEDPAELAKAMDTLMKGEWKRGELPERWDGRTAERIVQILTGK